jgi:hypothetical protein
MVNFSSFHNFPNQISPSPFVNKRKSLFEPVFELPINFIPINASARILGFCTLFYLCWYSQFAHSQGSLQPLGTFPIDRDTIFTLRPHFSWFAPSSISSILSPANFSLRLVQLDSSQTPRIALFQNPYIIHIENISQQSITYPAQAVPLQSGGMYAWQIVMRQVVNVNDVIQEVEVEGEPSVFYISSDLNSSCLVELDSVIPIGFNSIDGSFINFSDSSINGKIQIRLRENYSNNFSDSLFLFQQLPLGNYILPLSKIKALTRLNIPNNHAKIFVGEVKYFIGSDTGRKYFRFTIIRS